jgi:hypothetical protein
MSSRKEAEKLLCTYKDYANATGEDAGNPDSALESVDQAVAGTAEVKQKPIRFNKNFPVKLHYMLNELEKDSMDYIIAWQPHGRCFVVHNQEAFVSLVLPRYVIEEVEV